MRELMVLARDRWGQWRYETTEDQITFDDDATLARWNAGTARIEQLAADEDAAQRRVLGAPPPTASAGALP